MDVQPISSTEFLSLDRQVCIHSLSLNTYFLHMVSTPSSICTRCSVSLVGGNVLVCWEGMFLYASPLICLIPKVLQDITRFNRLSSNNKKCAWFSLLSKPLSRDTRHQFTFDTAWLLTAFVYQM